MPVDFSRFAAVLRDLGVAGEVRELPESAPTAAAAAAQLGCELGAIANSLVFSADGVPLLVMTSGAHRVEEARARHREALAELPPYALQLSRGYPAIPTIFGHPSDEA